MLCFTVRTHTQWNDKDLDALLNDSDEEDAKPTTNARSSASAVPSDDERQAKRLVEVFCSYQLPRSPCIFCRSFSLICLTPLFRFDH